MAIRAEIYEPKQNNFPGSLVMEPLGFTGTIANSQERIKMAAHLAQVPFAAIERIGANTTVFDLGMKRRLHPAQYEQTMVEHIEELGEALPQAGSSFDKLIGHGTSGGGASVLALAKLGIFDRILIRDGVYVHARNKNRNQLIGTLGFLSYQLAGEISKPKAQHAPKIPHVDDELTGKDKLWQAITDIRHYRHLMLSTYTTQALRELAGTPFLPIRLVGLGHTFSGSPAQTQAYADELITLRSAAETRLQQTYPLMQAAGLKASVAPHLYHSDLVTRPDITADHVHETFNLYPAIGS
jgi:hypothetical protein